MPVLRVNQVVLKASAYNVDQLSQVITGNIKKLFYEAFFHNTNLSVIHHTGKGPFVTLLS